MKKAQSIAALALLAVTCAAAHADAQAAAPNAAAAARLAKLKARQDAILAAAKAKAAASAATAAPTATTPPVTATAAPTASAKPATSATPATSASAKPATSASAAPAASAAAPHPDTASIALDLDALKKTRPDRRHAEFLDLQARFGSLLVDPRAVAELKQHGQRIAYLQRVRALAVKANDANFVKGVDALITTEETRDANALNALRTSALPVAPAPAAVATATATAVAVPTATAPAGGAK